MRRTLLLMILILLIPPSLAATAAPQQTGDTLPVPEEYPAAGSNCQRRVNLSPWVGTPGVDWPNTFRCVLSINTCRGVKTFTSGVRNVGTGMCDDYWRAHNALVNREICCDQGSGKEDKPPGEKGSQARKCEPPPSWFDPSSGCRELKSPQLVIRRGAATLYMCGYAVFSYSNSGLNDPLFAKAYRAAMRDQLLTTSSSKVCCDTFRDAVRTRKPCDPREDVDCDGTPNRTDSYDSRLPDIDTFNRPNNAAIDPFPYLFDTSNPDFLPNRTARNSKGVGECACKWELVKGDLKCSPDGKQKHHYRATWRCPSTGAEVITVNYAPATAPCER